MTELEKLQAGLPYCFTDSAIEAIKKEALRKCQALNAVDILNTEERTAAIKDLFGTTGKDVSVFPDFNCDNGKDIHVGEQFLMNYNGIILDVAEIRIDHHVMIGPDTMITTVDQQGRRDNIGVAKPVTIGNDVWIGDNVTILPGVTIGNNVMVAADAVVTKNIPDNCVVADVPAKMIKAIDNDID